MDSAQDTLAGGFPHSEISGSKSICRLPGAFRRLSRLSSPVVAKAFTVCASSLDPLTPNFRGVVKQQLRVFAHAILLLPSLRTTHIVKEQRPYRSKDGIIVENPVNWWSQAGSNRRPSACKADALPAELWPRSFLVGLDGLEPSTSPLSGVRSNRLSYRPALGCLQQVIGGDSRSGDTLR